MGRVSEGENANDDLEWLVFYWKRLPPEVRLTILNVARNVIDAKSYSGR
jgi:hypothetical protein